MTLTRSGRPTFWPFSDWPSGGWRETSPRARPNYGAQRFLVALLPTGQLNAHAGVIESSRFCVDTSLPEGRGEGSIHEATLSMFPGIIEWSMLNRFTEIVTVTDLRFERILARVGWPLQRIGEAKKIGVTMAVAGTLPASAEMFLKLRPSSYRSQFTSPLGQAA
ncbi:N-acyl-L-homoserine lactone synthetase [Rhizobium leguminosarum]|nr:N-acyl-L-homoserine lactone synthetase [Rhizobium leguminosarum]